MLENTVARWVTGKSRRSKTSELMKSTGWLTVNEKVKIATSTFTWKLVHRGRPARLLERMKVQDDYSIQVDRPRLQLSRKAYRWRGADQWNAHSQEMRQEPSIARFKRALRTQILQERTWDPGE